MARAVMLFDACYAGEFFAVYLGCAVVLKLIPTPLVKKKLTGEGILEKEITRS